MTPQGQIFENTASTNVKNTHRATDNVKNVPVLVHDAKALNHKYWLLNPLHDAEGKNTYLYVPKTQEYLLLVACDSKQIHLRRKIPVYRDLVPFKITDQMEERMNAALYGITLRMPQLSKKN